MTIDFPKLTTSRWSSSDETKRFTVENSATRKTLTTIQAGDASTVDQAVQASQVAFETRWKPLSARERSIYLLRCADELSKHTDELATILSLENGKPKADALAMDVVYRRSTCGSRIAGYH